tara:strand:- start:283 stop:591 length:309 start_codon:yes stop_codon:yes gene_type:complete
MLKKIIYILVLIFFVTSCGGTWDSVKRGLTGKKAQSTDEFMIKKKDPLILPPDFENLPTPDDRVAAAEEISDFKKNLESSIEEDFSTSSSVEDSILKKIQSK